MPSRSWFWASALGFLLAATALARQPAPDGPESPLTLIQGLRDAGMPDLALEYLRDVEGKLSSDDRVLVPLERARCILDAANEEPDEGTRASMVGEAKEAFTAFLASHAKHPRAAEASLALARLTSLEGRAQLNRARRMEVPPDDDPGHDEAVKQQRAELLKARPHFLQASKQFAAGAEQLKSRLKEPELTPGARQALAREAFDADLASAVNKYYLADTYLLAGAKDALERNDKLEEARVRFAELAAGPQASRSAWIARAWVGEILSDQGKPNEADKEFAAVLATRQPEAQEGQRLARFFQIRRKFEKETLKDPITVTKLQGSAQDFREWLARHGKGRRPSPEALAVRYYLAVALQLQVEVAQGPPPKQPPAAPPALNAAQRRALQESEKLLRELGQSDNDYTVRADRRRTAVVRKLLGEADRPPSAYRTFEEAQMAALIQVAKLQDAERDLAAVSAARDDDAPFWQAAGQTARAARSAAEVADRRRQVVAVMEHARELATDKDNPNDVTDNLLRLVYFYHQTDRPHQAAVLGEYVARTMRTTGGKAAAAGVLALRGYAQAGGRAPDVSAAAEAAAAVREVFPLFPEIGSEVFTEYEQQVSELQAAGRRVDRARAVAFARFLDEKFPNDAATDAARHQLAALLTEEKRFDDAFDVIARVRPGYSAVHVARQFEVYLARQIITAKDSAATPERKRDVFRRAAADLGKIPRPGGTATAEDARGYLACRLQLAQLYLTQSRADPGAEADPAARGYALALGVADEVLAAIPTFDALAGGEKKVPEDLTLDGQELRLQALDVRTRATYLQARALADEGKLGEADAAVAAVVAEVTKSGALYDARMKQWSGGQGDAGDPDAVGKQKSDISRAAAGVDKVRRDVVMVGFKLAAAQGKKDEAAKLLDLLKAAGGGVESNQQTMELTARELAAQIPGLRRAGKVNEAKALGDGLALLLQEFTRLKELPTATVLFLGQTFYTVGQYDEALAQLAKIKPPTPPAALNLPPGTPWWEADPLKVEDGQARKKFQDEVRDYRFAQLYTARALRGLGGPRLAESQKLLAAAVGDAKAKGYAYNSLDFRKELGLAYEAVAAATADPRAANAEWVKALKEWTTLFQIAQERVRQIKPKSELDPGTPPDEARRLRNEFFDAYFEPQRVQVTANAQLIRDPARLEASYARVAKGLFDLETVNKFNDPVEVETSQGKAASTVGAELLTPEVATRYWELVESNPVLKSAYVKAGGKFFLTKPKTGG
ncbi:MAG TPA: hypothetical protein VM529_10645 [Gemmata sp.]|nr:hypothetical protein [Gemmata sp.]